VRVGVTYQKVTPQSTPKFLLQTGITFSSAADRYYGSPTNYLGNCNFSTLTSITAEQDTIPDPTHFSPNSPAGQAPMPDRRRHAHSASPKVLSPSTALRTSFVEGLRDPIQSSPVKLDERLDERSSWTNGPVSLRSRDERCFARSRLCRNR